MLLSKTVTLTEGVFAFAVLIFLQFAVTWASVRPPAVRALVKNEPKLLVYGRRFLRDAMQSERVAEPEIRLAGRDL